MNAFSTHLAKSTSHTKPDRSQEVPDAVAIDRALSSHPTCLCCSNILLRHIRPEGIYWRCSFCHADMPV